MGAHAIAYCDNRLDGPPLVLLHGLFDTKATWLRLAPLLPQYRLIAPDLLGHGDSAKPDCAAEPPARRYAPDMQVDALRDFIAALDLDKLVLVGSSLGGGLALRLLLRFPELQLRGLVLIAAAGYPQALPGYLGLLGGWPGRLLATAPLGALARHAGLLRLISHRTFRRCFHDPDKIPPALVAATHAALAAPGALYAYHQSAKNIVPPDNADFHRRFADIACPTLVLWGARDRVLDPRNAHRFAADIPGAELHLLPDCGHAPHLEYPATVARHIAHFVSKLP
ncbi:alpha/beta hydrolase [bacterium]|nr:alpha/beta hydrolase [bacterium]